MEPVVAERVDKMANLFPVLSAARLKLDAKDINHLACHQFPVH
jgi:hypothetical protein